MKRRTIALITADRVCSRVEATVLVQQRTKADEAGRVDLRCHLEVRTKFSN